MMLLNRNRDSEKKCWYLEGTLDNGEPWIIQLNSFPFYIGREKECNLSILSNTISRKHAEIYEKGDFLYIRDLKSTNGSFVNKVMLKEEQRLIDGDSIKFGDIEFTILLKLDELYDESEGTIFMDAPQRSDDFTRHFDLTRREEEILFYLLQGKSTKSIADETFISPGTAKNHILNIFKKTDVHSRFELLTLYNNFMKNSK